MILWHKCHGPALSKSCKSHLIQGRHTQVSAESVSLRIIGAMQRYLNNHIFSILIIFRAAMIFWQDCNGYEWKMYLLQYPRWLIGSLGRARATLVCSTMHYVSYRTKAWYATMAGMLFLPPIWLAYLGAPCLHRQCLEDFENFSPNARAFAWPDSGPTHYLGLSRAWDLNRLILTMARLRPGLLGPTRLSTSLRTSLPLP